MQSRIDLFNQIDEIKKYDGLAEAIVSAEETYENQLSDSFSSSVINYNVGITIARVGEYYFISKAPNSKQFNHFDSLPSAQIHITNLFNEAAETVSIHSSWKAFWLKELAKL